MWMRNGEQMKLGTGSCDWHSVGGEPERFLRERHPNESTSPDLREKFIRTELELFRQRFDSDDQYERSQFLKSLSFDWTTVDDTEKRMYEKQLKACMSWGSQRDTQFASESWVKVCLRCVDWASLAHAVHRYRGIMCLILLDREKSSSRAGWRTFRRVIRSVLSFKHSGVILSEL